MGPLSLLRCLCLCIGPRKAIAERYFCFLSFFHKKENPFEFLLLEKTGKSVKQEFEKGDTCIMNITNYITVFNVSKTRENNLLNHSLVILLLMLKTFSTLVST